MRIPYSVKGALFAPALVALIFGLKIICPAPLGAGCFADHFVAPMFLPLVLIEKFFGPGSFILSYEMVIVLVYWALVGLLVGLCIDIYRNIPKVPGRN